VSRDHPRRHPAHAQIRQGRVSHGRGSCQIRQGRVSHGRGSCQDQTRQSQPRTRQLSSMDVQLAEWSARTINEEGWCGGLRGIARARGPHHGDKRLKHAIECLSHHALDALRSLFCSPQLACGRLRQCRLGGQLEDRHRSDATRVITLPTPISVCKSRIRRWRSLGMRRRRELLC
jgi:hypothetical protein